MAMAQPPIPNASAEAESHTPSHSAGGRPCASRVAPRAVTPIATPPQPGTAVNAVARSMVERMKERLSMARAWRAGSGDTSDLGRRVVMVPVYRSCPISSSALWFKAPPRQGGRLSGPQVGCAVGTAAGTHRYGGAAVGAVLCGRGCGGLLRFEPVGHTNDQEHREGYDDERDYVVDEVSIVDCHGPGGLRICNRGIRRRCLEAGLEQHEQVGKIDIAHGEPDGGHDDVIDQ